MQRSLGVLLVVAAVLSLGLVLPLHGQETGLGPGAIVPDCSKVFLLHLEQSAGDARYTETQEGTLEPFLRERAVLILHFCNPAAGDWAAQPPQFVAEVSAVRRAAAKAPYACHVVLVIPTGRQGADVASTVMGDSRLREQQPWGGASTEDLYWEPGYPRPGLYRTFRPGGALEAAEVAQLPATYIIGPGRRVLAARPTQQEGGLYEWIVANLPPALEFPPGEPTGTADVADPAANWPCFLRSPQHGPAAPGAARGIRYPYGAYALDLGRTFASPAVVDGLAYVFTENGELSVVNVKTGQRISQTDVGRGAMWSSPCVTDKYVYVADARGDVWCLARRDFERRWRHSLGAEVTSSPVVVAGRLYLGCHDGAFYCLDALTGRELWRLQTGGEVCSTASVFRGRVYFGSGDRRLYALDAATGAEQWTYETRGWVDASPWADAAGVLIGSFDGSVYAVGLDGKQQWQRELDGAVHSSSLVVDGNVFVGTLGDSFYRLDRATGEVLGQVKLPDAIYSSPAAWGDLVLIGCRDGAVYALQQDFTQGPPVWARRTKGHVHATPVIHEDTVLAASYDGRLYAFRAPKPPTELQPDDAISRWTMAAAAAELDRLATELLVTAAQQGPNPEARIPEFDTVWQTVLNAYAQPPAAAARAGLAPDVPADHPGAPFISYALAAGMVSGFPDATFRPEEPARRYQLAAAFERALTRASSPEFMWQVLRTQPQGAQAVNLVLEPLLTGKVPLEDVPYNHWARESCDKLAAWGVLPTDAEGRFNGDGSATLSDLQRFWSAIREVVRVAPAQAEEGNG